MTSKTRIDNFQGTDSQYIIYLETKVTELTRNNSPPPSPPSDVRDVPIPGFKFVPYEPDSLCLSTRRSPKAITRWQKEMDVMLHSFPSAEDWSSKRKFTGLSSETKLLLAFDRIIGSDVLSPKPITVESNSRERFELGCNAIRLVGGYAKFVAAMNTEKLFTTQIVNFCNLIFVSQCCVLLHHGVEKCDVDELMELCISQSDPKNLDVLRRGATWANRMISALTDDGLGQLASEAFVLCGGTVAQYGRFADAGENGFSYFRKSVSTSGYDDLEFEVCASLHFWIPFFIRTILGDIYSLSGIRKALGYSEHLRVDDDYSEWLQIYRTRKTRTISTDPLGSGDPEEVDTPLTTPALTRANKDYTQRRQRPEKRGKSTGPDPKRRRLGEDSRCDITSTTICADETSIGIWDDRLGEPLDFEGILDTEVQLLDDTLTSGYPLGMWDDRLGEPLDLGGHINLGDQHGVSDTLGMWDGRLGEPLDFDEILDIGTQHGSGSIVLQGNLGL